VKRGYYQFIGREIFQQKRVDEGPLKRIGNETREATGQPEVEVATRKLL
jgi:hypothetical protein